MSCYLCLRYELGKRPIYLPFASDSNSFQKLVEDRHRDAITPPDMKDGNYYRDALNRYAKIYVFDNASVEKLLARGVEKDKILLLDIPEGFEDNNAVLMKFLEEKFKGLK